MSTALEAEVPLPISIVSDLGRGYLRQIFKTPDEDQVRQIIALWPKLVLTAKAPQVLDKHVTAASNALCVYLNCGVTSNVPAIQHLVLSREAWFDALQCAHKAFDDGKTKPAFQIMETLCDVLRKMSDQQSIVEILRYATLPLIKSILLSSPQSEVKKACLMISCLHRKTPIGESLESFTQQSTAEYSTRWNQRLVQHNIGPADVSCIDNDTMASLFLALIFASVDVDTRSAAMKLYSLLCTSSAEAPANASLQVTAERVIELYLEKNHEALGDFAQNVLPMVLYDRERFMAFIEPRCHSCCESESTLALFLSSLRVGIQKNLLSDKGMYHALIFVNSAFTTASNPRSRKEDRYYWFRYIFMVASSELRVLTYALLTANPSTNAVIDVETLDCIASSLRYLHEDADAHERGEILSTTKRLLSRIQTSYTYICRKSTQNNDDHKTDALLRQYRSFSTCFFDFLKEELAAGISYPRHILSLQSLKYFFSLAIEPHTFDDDLVLTRSLCNLTLDPFEEVRVHAAALLRILSMRSPKMVLRVAGSDFLQKVEMLAVQTVRGDHADGMGRLLAVLSLLSDTDDSVKSTVETAVLRSISRLEHTTSEPGNLRPGSTSPVHGYLLTLYYQLQNLQGHADQDVIAHRVFSICYRIWEEVQPQLCVDSPETATELADDEGTEGPKDLLAYSWRALRDSSLVIQALLTGFPPDREMYSVAGRLCMDQLMSLRHRGAFSTVAQTFLACCNLVRGATQPAIRGLINDWYKIALNEIDEQASRLTRRSAGLPAMMTALLSPTDGGFFSSAVCDLMAIARLSSQKTGYDAGQLRLPQVHALNCLKDIMTSSRFSTVITQFLSSILDLAAFCLSSKIWAIRNCGLMLLRACIGRLNSTSTSEQHVLKEPSAEVTRDYAPTTVALRLLESARNSRKSDLLDGITEHVFAGLDLLAHAQQGEANSDSLVTTIAGELSNPTWAVRDRAAYLIANRLSSLGPSLAARTILEIVAPIQSENEAHGVLLCCKYSLIETRQSMTEPELDGIVTSLAGALATSTTEHYPSPYVSAAWLDVLNEAAVFIWDNGWCFKIIEKHSPVSQEKYAVKSNSVHGKYLSQRVLLLQVYRQLMQDERALSGDEVTTRLVRDLVANSEGLSFCVRIANERLSSKPRLSLITLLIGLIADVSRNGTSQQDVLEQAFCGLEQCLSRGVKPDSRSLQILSQQIILDQLGTTRDLFNAALKLEAQIIAGFVLPNENYIAACKRVTVWVDAVKDASRDALDFPTRLGAATALSTLTGHFQSFRDDELGQGVKVNLLLVLYDLLNDDDEEVRHEAVTAAAKLHLRHTPAVGGLGLCVLAARERLLEEIILQYGQTSLLAEAALLKLMQVGQDNKSDFSDNGPSRLFETSVASRIQEILKSKNDLFAEEKQNLYIDDVREIKSWTRVLSRSAIQSLSQQQFQAAIDWTLEGLNQTLSSLPDCYKSEQSAGSMLVHPLGVTYDHELLVVFLQVVSLAGILSVYDQVDNAEGLTLVCQKLEKMASVLADTAGNAILADAVTNALKGNPGED
ncbi:phosphatidylinositol glycan, class A [Exophiala viscosa]|uniref:Phosphatidylinositol glycan, class A n=1 Tax=Exophiala viscosa TaxID=2486360 RepID=A0AAN6DKK2_9EURO|nr:phosphatidylinositol glycan, class A [Exophiala viscosa]